MTGLRAGHFRKGRHEACPYRWLPGHLKCLLKMGPDCSECRSRANGTSADESAVIFENVHKVRAGEPPV